MSSLLPEKNTPPNVDKCENLQSIYFQQGCSLRQKQYHLEPPSDIIVDSFPIPKKEDCFQKCKKIKELLTINECSNLI